MARVTGFTPAQVAGCLMRDGEMCALANILPDCTGRASTANHRLNRGAGGSKLRNGLANACAICDHCNYLIEHDGSAAHEARQRGVKLREGDDPATVPMWSPFYRQMVQPGDEHMDLLGTEYIPRDAELDLGLA
jgi:hypothetical protein